MNAPGYVQIYFGDGKGKTTAAMGLAVRVLGAGGRVLIAQFLKTGESSEFASFDRLGPSVTRRHYGRPGFIVDQPESDDCRRATDGLREACGRMIETPFDLVIMDEILMAQHMGLLSLEAIQELLAARPAGTELILTGRKAHPDLLAQADLITEMREIRHYYAKGIPARLGIEF